MSKRNFGNDGIQASAPKFEKNVARTLQRGHSASGYFRMRGHERLSGGADAKSKSTVNVTKPGLEASSKVTLSASSKVAPEAEEEIEAILAQPNDQESTGDKKVDEMINYVIQNLQEAGKALASLGENYEHDLKLTFVDLMGKVQNWVSLAQMRLDAARNDLKNLRRELVSRSSELAARDREIAEVKKKLAETEVAKSVYEKALVESAQKIGAPLPSPSMMSFVPSRQPILTGVQSANSGHLPADSQHLPGGNSASVYPQGASVTSAQSSHPDPSGAASGHSAAYPQNLPGGTSASVHPEGASAPNSAQSSYPSAAYSQNLPGGTSAPQGASDTSAQSSHPIPSSTASGHPLSARGEGPGGATSTATLQYQQQAALRGPTSAQDYVSQQQRLTEGPATADVAVQSGKGKERKRESELESELARLRKENEQIAKERADYENAIQRALLRGVSSLNAETLKVLRCPPVSCYTPCGPPPSPVNTVETMTPCLPTKIKDDRAAGCRKAPTAFWRRGGSKIRVDESPPHEERGCCGAKTSTTSTYGLSSRYRKSSGNSHRSMAFILQQAASPAAGIAPGAGSQARTCGRSKSRKAEASICARKLG